MEKKAIAAVILFVISVLVFVTVYAQLGNSTKERVPSDSSGLYFRDQRGVYLFVPRGCGFFGCFGPDLRSETVKYEKIPFADPKTFQILTDPKSLTSNSGEILARDDSHIFYGGEYVPTGDVKTLTLFGSYAKDKNNLYFRGMVITGIDISTAKIAGLDFISDRNGLYVANAIPPRKAALVDASTFEFHPPQNAPQGRDHFAEDKNFYYSWTERTESIASQTRGISRSLVVVTILFEARCFTHFTNFLLPTEKASVC